MLLDGEPLTEAALVERVQQESRHNPQLRAVIAADRGVVYDRVIRVIDVVKSNGVKSFALNIQREHGPSSPVSPAPASASATRFE